MCDLTATAEARALAHDDARPVLFMATITAPPLCLAPRRRPPPPKSKPALWAPPHPLPRRQNAARDSGTLARLSPASAGPSLPAADVCCLEGCGLGWRVRPPLRRRGPWEVLAQRMRLSVEALGGARIEKVYTLLDLHELAPRTSYEVCVGDLHAGDECHVPVLVSLPALAVPVPCVQVVRFSLTYVDALRIDTKSTELCTTIVRAAARARPRRRPLPPPLAHLAHPSRPRSAGRVGPARAAAAARLDRPRAQPRPRRRGAPPRRRRRQRGLARRRAPSSRRPRRCSRARRRCSREIRSASRSTTSSPPRRSASTPPSPTSRGAPPPRSSTSCPLLPGGAQSSPNSVLNAFVGGAAPSSREALKPRTFCVTLPFGSLGGATSASSRGEPSSAGSSQHAAGPSSAGSSHGVPRDGAASSPLGQSAGSSHAAWGGGGGGGGGDSPGAMWPGGRRRCASRPPR